MRNACAILVTATLLAGGSAVSAKTGSVIVTSEMRANAVRNCERHEWAATHRDNLIAQVKPWLDMSDEELWNLLPSQDMPRDASVNRGEGCPNCGMEHYEANYNPSRWRWDFADKPWKVRCANCDEWFPKNDFQAYYESALDEQGKFRQGAGDPQFLEPEEGAPAEWTDDGTGAKVGENKWFFGAYYAFRIWQHMLDTTERFAILYTLTEDPIYAHKAGVLLDRMADLYPEIDYRPHYSLGMEASTGGSGEGRVQGCIWETWTAQKLSLAYDYTYDALLEDEELVEFSQAMSVRYGTGDKSSAQTIANHMEEHLLREFIIGVLDKRIWGNEGMHQYSMAAAAVALDNGAETEEALDWLFEADGGRIPHVLVEFLGREGLSHESGLGYARIPATSFQEVAEVLSAYEPYTKHDLYRDYPKFRNCFTMCSKVRALDRYSPAIGDSGKAMNIGDVGLTLPVEMSLAGYRLFPGPETAREVWFSNGKRVDGLRLDIYDAEPEAIQERLREELAGPPRPLASYNAGGYGLAVLQNSIPDTGTAAMMYYGRMAGHGHEDRLSISVTARDVVMSPDLGYPLYTGHWPKRVGWTSHIISHNTCMVNDKGPERDSYSGKTKLFAEAGPVAVADVDGGEIYEGVSTYRRCLVKVEVNAEDAYFLDLFWVRGGTNHRLIQNGGGPEVTHSGLRLTEQTDGTYAGPDVGYGEFYDGPDNWDYDGTGFMYLQRVSKAQPADAFWVDWLAVEPRRTMPEEWEAHLRVHNLSAVDEVALCDGIPPEYKGNPPSLRYMLRTRFGEALDTQFVSVLEPYGKQAFIQSARLVREVTGPDSFAAVVEVELADGRRDVILVSENPTTIEAEGTELSGRVGFARFDGDGPVELALIAGTSVSAGGAELQLPAAQLTGTLAGWDDSDPADVRLTLEPGLVAQDLERRAIIFDSSERSDASYRIERIVDATTVSVGGNSLAERFVDTNDYAQGVHHTISEGDAFSVALTATWQRE